MIKSLVLKLQIFFDQIACLLLVAANEWILKFKTQISFNLLQRGVIWVDMTLVIRLRRAVPFAKFETLKETKKAGLPFCHFVQVEHGEAQLLQL